MAKVLRMIFADPEGSKLTMTVDNPKEDLTDANVVAAMDTIIAQGAVRTKSVAVQTKVDAEIVNTQVSKVTLG